MPRFSKEQVVKVIDVAVDARFFGSIEVKFSDGIPVHVIKTESISPAEEQAVISILERST